MSERSERNVSYHEKKFIAMLLLCNIALAGCSSNSSDSDDRTETQMEPQENAEIQSDQRSSVSEDPKNILVAYFSWADNAVLDDDVDAISSPSVIPPGNVQQLAGWVQEETGGDLFSIRVTDPYPSDWDACLDRANEERTANARPELVENAENIEEYDTVFLGYPNWWYGVPMPLLTFLEENNLSGKQVYLFCSHGTGGLAESVELITEAAPDAVISENIFDCYEEEASSSQEEIQGKFRIGRERLLPGHNDDIIPLIEQNHGMIVLQKDVTGGDGYGIACAEIFFDSGG